MNTYSEMVANEMIGLTELEAQVLQAAATQCYDDYASSAKEISELTNLDIKTVKGVVGSLVKKGKMQAEEEERSGKVFLDLFVVLEGNLISYGCDKYEQ